MKRTLRAPLMVEQVKTMIDSRMEADTILEDNAYWSGFVDALAAAGLITEGGYTKLVAYIKEAADQVYCPLEEPELIASPEEVLKAINEKFPAASTSNNINDFFDEFLGEKDEENTGDDSLER